MTSLTFDLHGDYVELNVLLKLAGLCDSGGAGKHLVASGAVEVDGAPELRKTHKIRAGQVVRLGATEIHVRAAAGGPRPGPVDRMRYPHREPVHSPPGRTKP